MEQKHDARHLIEVRPSPSKGLGVFANADIPRGTRVVAEPYLLRVNNWSDNICPHTSDIIRAYERLSSSEQEQYLSLTGHASKTFKAKVELETNRKWHEVSKLHRTVLSIYITNAFEGVCLLGSRFNHSCIPNLNFVYNTALEKATFHATRDIAAGEELTLDYTGETNCVRSKRQSKLKTWGFECTCPACENTVEGEAKERKRKELRELEVKLMFGARLPSVNMKSFLKVVTRMAAIQVSEGLVSRTLRFTYHDAVRCAIRMADARMALLWAEKELEVDQYCIGEDHPEYAEGLDVVKRLRAAVDGSGQIDGAVEGFYKVTGPLDVECCVM